MAIISATQVLNCHYRSMMFIDDFPTPGAGRGDERVREYETQAICFFRVHGTLCMYYEPLKPFGLLYFGGETFHFEQRDLLFRYFPSFFLLMVTIVH